MRQQDNAKPGRAPTIRSAVPDGKGRSRSGREERWLAEARVDESIRERSLSQSLARQLRDEATFAGLCGELAASAAIVVVRTRAGQAHNGSMAAVGSDHVVIDGPARRRWIRFDAIAALRTRRFPFAAVPSSATPTTSLAEVLRTLVVDRPTVTLHIGLDEVVGELCHVGDDVVELAVGDRPPMSALIRSDSIDGVTVDR